jgi:hypothetical protein
LGSIEAEVKQVGLQWDSREARNNKPRGAVGAAGGEEITRVVDIENSLRPAVH